MARVERDPRVSARAFGGARVGLGRHKQRKSEGCSLTFNRTHLQDGSVRFNDLSHEREPETSAPRAAFRRAIQLTEWFEDLLQIRRRDADARVSN